MTCLPALKSALAFSNCAATSVFSCGSMEKVMLCVRMRSFKDAFTIVLRGIPKARAISCAFVLTSTSVFTLSTVFAI